MVEEKRRYIRGDNKVRVTYSLGEEDEFSEGVFTENISEVGLQIIIENRIEQNQVLQLKLEFMSDSVPIIADCRVVYVKPESNQHRIGLEFINMDNFQKQRLKRCLEEVRKDS